ncbi:acetyl-CoA carboxylase biotin carboxylase subunit [Sphaerisporangium krabiense]|uniref:biotin carboxylase n=1 Tax=Sphaerisporangium krabiense TaxID=763782 RepID=A0A7W8ZCA1_9ACTN|nr:biotin carboxylase N-terminal domain-containing protein [Sphaerisporangium krabiense]MBB5631381.1 acetyl-CoA carboxylase biotin carboxylase subunit [Sphaerisporangium krabiense]GII60798.1 acetyl-CoA carboxylase biotin carboxylase subunit [Sphaerisporangium krabiense]
MFTTVLIANRGEIALRVLRTCREMGVRTVVAHSTVDRDSPAVRLADESIQIGPAAPRRSYLNAAALIAAARQSGAEAIHPGYGFLSESAEFAEICQAHGITLIGPAPAVIARLGDKVSAREFAAEAGLPLLPGGDGPAAGVGEAARTAAAVGYPVVLKAAAGGGGRAMTVVHDPGDLARAYAATRREAVVLFGDARVYVEKYLDAARHVEVQILADAHGQVLHLGARDCSVQRRRQKLIEETPPPGLPAAAVERLGELSVRAAHAAGYTGAGTFEYVVDEHGACYFIEVNCRLQVEHPITEMVTGIDLVREQLLVAAGGRLSLRQEEVAAGGAAIECRLNAEDPARGFLPTPGVVEEFVPPGGPFTRVDTHAVAGTRITADYDPLLAKVSVWAPTRAEALARADRALEECTIRGQGVRTNVAFLREVLAHPLFRYAKHTTALVEQMRATPIT